MFESALFLLFSVCRHCCAYSVNVSKETVGSFVRITQTCSSCKQIFVWDSQPFIGRIPAGNILTSAAILFSGALPSQSLRIFDFLKCHNITLTTFFRHQRRLLQPAVSKIWEQQQLSFISRMKNLKKKLILSGDGRADSPGHSAKYGCYTVVEMTCNKVVDYKLVQVYKCAHACSVYTCIYVLTHVE